MCRRVEKSHSTSGKGLKHHIVTVLLYQITLTSIGTFEEPEKLENPEQPEAPFITSGKDLQNHIVTVPNPQGLATNHQSPVPSH